MDAVDLNKLTIPYLILRKDTDDTVSGEYIDPNNPERNFIITKAKWKKCGPLEEYKHGSINKRHV